MLKEKYWADADVLAATLWFAQNWDNQDVIEDYYAERAAADHERKRKRG